MITMVRENYLKLRESTATLQRIVARKVEIAARATRRRVTILHGHQS